MLSGALGTLFGLVAGFVLRMIAARSVRRRLAAREARLKRRTSAIPEGKSLKGEIQAAFRAKRLKLAEVAGLSVEEAMALVENRLWARIRPPLRTREPERVLRDVCERYDGHVALDRTDYPVRMDDVIAKETERRVQQSAAKNRDSVLANVRKDARRAGRDAFSRVGLPIPAEAIVALVGALKFRTSYAQNQYEHSIEVAELAGMLAREADADDTAARRSGLMHDMGKAETHDRDGSHATVAARLADKCGEVPSVVNAIAAHHGEVPVETAVGSLLITADTLSGARPGARRQSTSNYADMVRDIVSRVQNRRGVVNVDVMQAGREVRVMVDPEVADDALGPFAQSIADDLENARGLTGHVRVTVIREQRASAIAR